MNVSFPLPYLRRLGSTLPGRRAPRFTADEVRNLLDPRADGDAERRDLVLATAAVPASWTSYVGDAEAWRLGRVVSRLPTIIFWYRAGQSFEEIGGRLGLFGGPWLAERALGVAARCIAERLNERGAPAVRGAV